MSCLLVGVVVGWSPSSTTSKPTKEQWQEVKSGLKSNREAMCSFLLDNVETEEDPLTLDKVTALFERSLDHLAKASEYVAKIRPHLDAQVVADFDNNGSSYVLEVSNARLDVIREYEEATRKGKGEQAKRQILERYFYKACANKLGTILAEKSMYDAALKVKRTLSKQVAGQ